MDSAGEVHRPPEEVIAGAGVSVQSFQGLVDVRSGRRAGAAWKQVLPI